MPFDQRSLIHREAWFPPCFVRQSQQKNKLFLRGDFRPLPNENVQMWDHFFTLLFPKNSESLKILDIRLREVGAKRRFNGTSKVNRRTDKQTNRQTDGQAKRQTHFWRCSDSIVREKINCPEPPVPAVPILMTHVLHQHQPIAWWRRSWRSLSTIEIIGEALTYFPRGSDWHS